MIGTLVNVGTIVVGSSVGAIVNKGLKEKYKVTLTQALGLVATSLGMTWIVSNMSDNNRPLLFIISLVVGGVVGEFIDIDSKVNNLSEKFKQKNGSKLIEGITTAVLLFCVGTMSIIGPLESALKGNHTLLFTNAMLDGVSSMILASTFGIGIIISAAILFVWQGSIYMLAHVIEPFITAEIMQQVSIIGGILILSTGINILGIAKIKTINLLPALVVPAVYYLIF